MAVKTKTNEVVAFTQPEMAHPNEAIITQCPRCNKEGEVRGLDLNDLLALSAEVAGALKKVNGGKQFAVVRMCANCRYRTAQNGKPMSEAQKDARKRYNKQRNEKKNAALAYVANLSDEERAAFEAQYMARLRESISHSHDGN